MLYIIIGAVGLLFNLLLEFMAIARHPAPSTIRREWYQYVVMVIPWSYLLIPLFMFLISPWRR